MSVMYSRLDPFEQRPETPISIAFGITGLDVGGAEKALVQLATRLDRSRWTPSVVCLQPEGPLAETLRRAGIEVRSLNVGSWRNVAGALMRWRLELVAREPALLQTFLFHANLLGRLAGLAVRVPVVLSGVRVAERRARGHLLADRLTHRLSDAHVCVSRAVADFQGAAANLPPATAVVIPNGVDVTSTPPAPEEWAALGLPPMPAKLVFVGRLEPQKGLDLLFTAMASLPAEKRPTVAILGAGPERERLERQVQQLDLAGHVRFLGWRPNPAEWIAADALVLPSRWEGMPNVLLEAMAVGKPVIASNVEGVAELVEPGRTGWVAAPDNAAALAAALSQFLDERPRWREMGEAARRKAGEEFSIARMVERYERLWLALLERHRRAGRPASHFVLPDYRH